MRIKPVPHIFNAAGVCGVGIRRCLWVLLTLEAHRTHSVGIRRVGVRWCLGVIWSWSAPMLGSLVALVHVDFVLSVSACLPTIARFFVPP